MIKLTDVQEKAFGYAINSLDPVVIWGGAASGKTTTAIAVAMEFGRQYPNSAVLFIDVSEAFARRNLFETAVRDYEDVGFLLNYNSNSKTFKFTNGSFIKIIGEENIDSVGRLRSYDLIIFEDGVKKKLPRCRSIFLSKEKPKHPVKAINIG